MALPNVPSGRLLVDSDGTAAWNMAVDEVMLENANVQEQATLRFYHWLKPSQSLGYFQRAADRREHHASFECDWVRRASGGGAILHDESHCDLTYSICVPRFPRRTSAQLELYHLFHESLVAVLAGVGVDSHLCTAEETTSKEPFLCFLRHSEGDVLLGTHKVAGSAQLRLGDAVLQHGSVLLSQSAFAPELPGIRQLSSWETDPVWLTKAWFDELQKRWPVAWATMPLDAAEEKRVREKFHLKFANPTWNRRR